MRVIAKHHRMLGFQKSQARFRRANRVCLGAPWSPLLLFDEGEKPPLKTSPASTGQDQAPETTTAIFLVGAGGITFFQVVLGISSFCEDGSLRVICIKIAPLSSTASRDFPEWLD